VIPKECKRLAEVDFPIAEVSKHAVEDLPVAPLSEHWLTPHRSGPKLRPQSGLSRD
jgi:hypothetical protein